MTTPEPNFGQLFKQLQQIVDWYDQQQELDIEAGLAKAKQAAELIKLCSRRLAQLENEFTKIKADLDTAAGPVEREIEPDEG